MAIYQPRAAMLQVKPILWRACNSTVDNPLKDSQKKCIVFWFIPYLKSLHCKETILKIRNKYSQERKCVATVPIPIHSCFCKRFIYSSDRSAYSAAGKWRWAERGYIQIVHRLMNVETGTEAAQYLFWGIHKFKFLCSADKGCHASSEANPIQSIYQFR